MSFNEYELNDILNFYNGKKRPDTNGKIPVYGGNGILNYCSEFNADGENIIIGRVGAYCGNVNFLDGKCWISDNAILSKAKENFHSKFLFYFLKNENLYNLRIGSSQPLITQSTLKKIKVKIPQLKQQKTIANLLSSLDEKIEVNNEINKNLEEMAQAIFKHWFIDFEFPNEEGKPYKSSGGKMVESEKGLIPEGWEVKNIGEVVKIVRGASPRPIQNFISDKGIPWLKISDATSANNKYILTIKEFIKEEGISKSRKIEPGTLVLSNSATPGIAKIMLVEACVHDGWLIFSEYKRITKAFMYYYLVKEREKILALSNGSVFRNLKTDILKSYPIIVPNLELVDKATTIFRSFNEDIKMRTLENEKIISIRDILLPKLMLGEIRVPLNEE